VRRSALRDERVAWLREGRASRSRLRSAPPNPANPDRG
jgi:hypothetical protein